MPNNFPAVRYRINKFLRLNPVLRKRTVEEDSEKKGDFFHGTQPENLTGEGGITRSGLKVSKTEEKILYVSHPTDALAYSEPKGTRVVVQIDKKKMKELDRKGATGHIRGVENYKVAYEDIPPDKLKTFIIKGKQNQESRLLSSISLEELYERKKEKLVSSVSKEMEGKNKVNYADLRRNVMKKCRISEEHADYLIGSAILEIGADKKVRFK